MPVIIAGADAEISQEVQSIGNKGFYRICYTDQVPGAGETLETADFDQDGLSNMSEIRPPNGLATHPLNPDTDADGLKDGWEVSHAFNPHDSSDAVGDKDSDGLTNLQEYQWGANPTNPDTDGDGALDGDEKDGNTNLKDPESAPQEGWIVLTGDYPKQERKALKRTVTIPKGQTCVVVVVLHSEEYPEYTEYDSEFDDLLEWKITPTGGTEIAGQADVNDKHADWQLAESNGTAIKNFYPAHIEKVSSLTAPPEKDLIVTLELAATNISDDEKPSTVMVGLLPVEVVFYKSDTESNEDWNSQEKILPAGEIYLIQAKDPEPIKFKVNVPVKITEEQFRPLKLYATSILGENSKSSEQKVTNFSLSELSKVTFHQTDNGSTARCQIDQDLWKSKFVMQSIKDSVFSVDWSDFDPSVDQYTKSTYEDSDVFDQSFEKISYSLNGKARGEGNWTEKEISDSVGKISSWSARAYSSSFKAAGYCRFTLNSASCAVMEQAKIAYFSTHGAHSYNIRLGGYPTGVIETAELSSDPTQPKRIYLKPEDMEWHAGLDVAVMAACAVLDVNDYNNNYKGANHFDSPGERWEKTGPRILLGYNNSAPIDIPNGLAIANQWARLVTTTNQGAIPCWAVVTYSKKAYNSCAIEKDVGYWYYPVEKIYFPKKKKPYLHVSPWTFVKKSDW